MLKLTHSFCRHLILTCENYNRNIAHVRKLTYFNFKGQSCHEKNNISSSSFNPFIHTSQQSRPMANLRKKARTKKLCANSNAGNTRKQISESMRPSVSHASCGGQLNISNEVDCDSWIEFSEETSTDKGKPNDHAASSDKESTRVLREIPPGFRIWELVGKKKEPCNDVNLRFKVVSYNVLAQYLLEYHPYLYKECAPHNLKWNVRATRLYDEILSMAPDILCLQEVQVSHLNSFYAKFEEIGYSGVFKQKTGQRQDGCAIYFKKSMFTMEEHINVEFYQPELPILNRDNIGVMLKLVPRSLPGCPIVVATTHLLYNPKRTDVRLAQLQVFLAEIDRFAYYNNGRQSGYLPIILTGDFNSTPDSAVIQLLDKGHVSASAFRDNSDWRRIGVTDQCQHLSVYLNRLKGRRTDDSMIEIYNSENCVAEPGEPRTRETSPHRKHSEMFNSEHIGHCLNLKSVYNWRKLDGSYEATTFQDYWVTVDYIYFSRSCTLKIVDRLRLPTVEECDCLGYLPNDVYGSDHLALAASFELKPFRFHL